MKHPRVVGLTLFAVGCFLIWAFNVYQIAKIANEMPSYYSNSNIPNFFAAAFLVTGLILLGFGKKSYPIFHLYVKKLSILQVRYVLSIIILFFVLGKLQNDAIYNLGYRGPF